MRIAICEDLKKDCDKLVLLLRDYLSLNSLDADIDVFNSGEDFLAAFAPGKYQILFQDIYLDKGGLNGMQAAEKVREADSDISIVFSTTSEEHGIASYKVDAAYYISKPLDEHELERALHKCRSQIDRFAKTVEIISDRQPVKIRMRDIFYAEVYAHNCVLHTVSGDVRTRIGLNALEEKLGGIPFIVCHRSYLVNLAHVGAMKKDEFVLKNGARVPISRTYAQAAQKSVNAFIHRSD